MAKAVVSQLPPFSEPFLDSGGRVTLAWRRFFESQWQRSGGFSDLSYTILLSLLGSDGNLAELTAQTDQNASVIETVRAQIAGGVLEALQQDTVDLQKQLSTLTAIINGGLSESLQQQIADLQQQISQLNAQIQGIRGEDNYTAVQTVTTTVDNLAAVAYSGLYSDLSGTPTLATVATTGAYADLTGKPTLATVATTGAYADLTGKPTLGTAASQNTGTSGANVPLLNGTNTWSSEQTFSGNIRVGTYTASAAPPITGYITVKDAAGTTRNLAVV